MHVDSVSFLTNLCREVFALARSDLVAICMALGARIAPKYHVDFADLRLFSHICSNHTKGKVAPTLREQVGPKTPFESRCERVKGCSNYP